MKHCRSTSLNGAGTISTMEDGEGRDSEEMMDVRGEAMASEEGVVVAPAGQAGTGTETIITEIIGLVGVVSAKKIGWQRRRGRPNSPLLPLRDAMGEHLTSLVPSASFRLSLDFACISMLGLDTLLYSCKLFMQDCDNCAVPFLISGICITIKIQFPPLFLLFQSFCFSFSLSYMCHLFLLWGGCDQKPGSARRFLFLFILNAGMAEKDLSEIIEIDSQVGEGERRKEEGKAVAFENIHKTKKRSTQRCRRM